MFTTKATFAKSIFQTTVCCLIAGVLIWQVGLAQTSGQHAPCIGNAQRLAQSMMLYAQDYDTELPPMQSAATFQKAVLPYIVIAGKRKQEIINGKVFDPAHIQPIQEAETKIKATAKDRKSFLCPATKKTYKLNPKLSNQVAYFTRLENPASVKALDDQSGYTENAETTWLFRDTSAHADSLYTIVFADTHAQLLKSPPVSK